MRELQKSLAITLAGFVALALLIGLPFLGDRFCGPTGALAALSAELFAMVTALVHTTRRKK